MNIYVLATDFSTRLQDKQLTGDIMSTLRTNFLCILYFGLSLTLFGAEESPWLVESKDRPAVPKRERMLWADSMQYKSIAEICGEPVIEVERWVNPLPTDLKGKFVLIEVWATWCPPCRRSLPLLEYFHEKYKDELVVVSICETDEEALKKLEGALKLSDLKAPLAVDTHRRFANALGVYGIPHAVLIDPIMGAVLWEGMPTQIGAELSDEVMSKVLANLKNPAVQAKIPPKAPFSFKAAPPDPNKKYRPAPENVGNAGW
jgi:thiol-disulfide isomerase/thioredoxin